MNGPDVADEDSGHPVGTVADHDSVRKHHLDVARDNSAMFYCHDCGLYTFGSTTGIGAYPCTEEQVLGGSDHE